MVYPLSKLLVPFVLLSSLTIAVFLVLTELHVGGLVPRYSPDLSRNLTNIVQDRVVPFNPLEPKQVVILSYQRSGSSFLGEIFNQNPAAFYMFEPLDSLYTATYGTTEGWNVGQDITAHHNGSKRFLPMDEVDAVSRFLGDILSCRLTSLPGETLVHSYWWNFVAEQRQLADYQECVRHQGFTVGGCQGSFTSGYCGKRFGAVSEDRMNTCKNCLANTTFLESSGGPVSRNFTEYKKCIEEIRIKTHNRCLHKMSKVCQRSEIRSLKVVRATMRSLKSLLRDMPNLRALHLVRDPRGVAVSRSHFDPSGRSVNAQGDLVKEAALYCRTALDDTRTRGSIERLYPGRILPVTYDTFVQDPVAQTLRIYKFLNSSLPEVTRKWLVEYTTQKKNSRSIATRWQDKLTFRESRQISEACRDFFLENILFKTRP